MGTKKDAKPASAKPKPKKCAANKPTLSKEDLSIVIFGLEALTDEEEQKEVAFAEEHITVPGPEGTPVPFKGTYADVCNLYKSYGKPTGSVTRTKALALVEKVKTLRGLTKK